MEIKISNHFGNGHTHVHILWLIKESVSELPLPSANKINMKNEVELDRVLP